MWTIGVVVRMSILDTKVAGSNLSINMFSPWARDFIRIASVDSAVIWVPGGDNLVKGVQCYELFGGIAHKNHAFSFISFHFYYETYIYIYVKKRILYCFLLHWNVIWILQWKKMSPTISCCLLFRFKRLYVYGKPLHAMIDVWGIGLYI